MIDNPYGDPPQVALHDVEWRIDGKPTEREGKPPRARYVPYIDARWCAAALDEWVGPQNWRDDYEQTTFMGKEAVIGIVSIRFGDEWVTKKDIGYNDGPANVAVKGTFSDAFKRVACGRWGVGRNVYDLPGDIWAEVRMSNGKAYSHPGAVHQIAAELAKRGHDIMTNAGEAKVQTGISSDTDATPEDAETLDETQVDAIAQQFAGLTGNTFEAAKAEWFAEWGAAKRIPTKNYEAALESAYRIATSHAAPPPGDAATPPAAPGAPPAEPSDSAPADEPDSPQESVPAEAVGLTFDEIDSMTARGLAEHLAQFGLDLTGNMAAKKARLKEHVSKTPATGGPGVTMEMWQAGANLPAHPDTGEALSTTAEYVDGISKYEDALGDDAAMLWNEWLSDTFPDTPWPPTAQYPAFVAYQTIHHLHTHGAMPDA